VIAPLVAAEDPRIAFVVMMAGSGVPGDELLLAQVRAVQLAEGDTPEHIEAALKIDRQIYDLEKSDLEAATVEARVVALMTEAGATPEAAKHTGAEARIPWFRWFLRYDPRPTLEKLRCPVLAIDGSKDTQVVAAQNLPAIRTALKHDKDVTVIEAEGLNHLFQSARTGGPDEYATIEQTLDPGVLKTMVDWVVAHATPQAAKTLRGLDVR
jgi:pimeloyl-ACP methyl ester carboxylesterase